MIYSVNIHIIQLNKFLKLPLIPHKLKAYVNSRHFRFSFVSGINIVINRVPMRLVPSNLVLLVCCWFLTSFQKTIIYLSELIRPYLVLVWIRVFSFLTYPEQVSINGINIPLESTITRKGIETRSLQN